MMLDIRKLFNFSKVEKVVDDDICLGTIHYPINKDKNWERIKKNIDKIKCIYCNSTLMLHREEFCNEKRMEIDLLGDKK